MRLFAFVAAVLATTALGAVTLPIGPGQSIVPLSAPALAARHCNFDLYATSGAQGPSADFVFDVVAALNGAIGAVSIRSTNYPDHFITLSPNTYVEPGRLGIAIPGADLDSASFLVVPGLANHSLYSFQSLSKNFPDTYMALNSLLKGVCSGDFPGGSDVTLLGAPLNTAATFYVSAPPPPPPVQATLAFDPTVQGHPINPLYMGCHSDSGFTHEERGFYSQMIYGESFETGPGLPTAWHYITPPTATGSAAISGSSFFHAQNSLSISYAEGSGLLGIANRGLGSEGLFIQGGKDYGGYFFAKSSGPVTITVELQDFTKNNLTLASTTVSFPGGNWTMLNFSLTTTEGTTCVGITPGSDPNIQCGNMGPASHICVNCGGQAVIGLATVGQVDIDYVFLQPGTWGRVNGLEVLASGVEVLQAIGVTTLRQGGSFTDPAYYFWKNWRGKPWARPSLGATWGAELISGWGPFEMIDMCAAAGIRPIITTTAQDGTACCAPDDMADLVEYCWGNASTEWGQVRIADGHPEPYNVTIFELGNEQYNSLYVDQVQAMEERAASLGMAKKLYYMFPSNGYLNDADGARAEQLNLQDHLLADFHVGGGGAVEGSANLFAQHPDWTMGTINCETNAGTHTMSRALSEGADMSDFFSQYIPSTSGDSLPRIKGRTASFCNERSGHYDAFDQGITFFLPNMTWIQPPGYVHQMIAQTWQPFALNATLTGGGGVSASAQVSADGATVRILFTNPAGPAILTLNVLGGVKLGRSANVTSLSATGDFANSPSNPTAISPVHSVVTLTPSNTLALPGNSVNTIVVTVLG